MHDEVHHICQRSGIRVQGCRPDIHTERMPLAQQRRVSSSNEQCQKKDQYADERRYCFLPDGSETPWTTYSDTATPSTSVPASTTVTEAASTTTSSEETASAAETSRPANPSATGCHLHGETKFCFVGSDEYEVVSEAEPSTAPDEYTECHWHDTEL